MRREKKKKKKGERESRGISATLLPKFLCPKCEIAVMSLPKKEKKKKICFGNCGNAIADNVKKKKNYFDNCGNPIAENGKKKL